MRGSQFNFYRPIRTTWHHEVCLYYRYTCGLQGYHWDSTKWMGMARFWCAIDHEPALTRHVCSGNYIFILSSWYVRVVARGTVHLSLYPMLSDGLAANRKSTNICRQKKCIGKSMFYFVLDRNTAAKDSIFVQKNSTAKKGEFKPIWA